LGIIEFGVLWATDTRKGKRRMKTESGALDIGVCHIL
jgi:hypothetical protein